MKAILENRPSLGVFEQQYIPESSSIRFSVPSSPLRIYTYEGLQSISANLSLTSHTLTRLGKQHGRGDKEGCFSYVANLPLQQFFSHNLYKKYSDKAKRFGQQGTNTLPKLFRGSAAVALSPFLDLCNLAPLEMQLLLTSQFQFVFFVKIKSTENVSPRDNAFD